MMKSLRSAQTSIEASTVTASSNVVIVHTCVLNQLIAIEVEMVLQHCQMATL